MYISSYGFHFLFLIILVLLLPHHPSSAVQLCPRTTCGGGDDNDPPPIHFPFRLRYSQSHRCGYPGFTLSCTNTNQTTQPQTLLDLPNSGHFTVQNIDYASQTIDLNDPDNCLPRRLLNFSLANSHFRAQNPRDFTLLNCSNDAVDPMVRPRLIPILCMSEGNYTVYSVPTVYYRAYIGSVPCKEVGTVMVPVPWSFWWDINEDMRLSWDVPDCKGCVARGGKCGYKDGNSTEIDCSIGDSRGLTRGAKYGLIIGAGVPGLLLIVGILTLIYGKITNIRRRRRDLIGATNTSPVLGAQPSIVSIGLDELTIESYPKMELGASRRLPKPNDNTCAICLSEYQPKETLRTIPECNHYFHAECIDEWLRINTTCPVCRNSPERSSLATSLSSLSLSTSLGSSEN